MQFKVLYSNKQTTLSKMVLLESERLNYFVKDVSSIRIDIVPSKTQAKSYAVLILIKTNEKKFTSLIFNFKLLTDGYDC